VKRLIVTALFFLIIHTLYSYEFKNVVNVQDNSIHYVFDEKANMRERPDIESKVVKQAVIGERILNRTMEESEIDNVIACWYEVDCESITGFMWGGFFSSEEIVADFNNDGKDEILMSRLRSIGQSELGDYKVFCLQEFVLCQKGKLLSKKPFIDKSIKPTSTPDGFTVYDDLGFKPNVVLLGLSYGIGDAGGYGSTTRLYYLKGNVFQFIYGYEEGGYSDDIETETENVEIQYPVDSKIPNTMIITKRKNSIVNGKEISNEITETTKLVWDDKAFKVKTGGKE
jgi:hypothetical protein